MVPRPPGVEYHEGISGGGGDRLGRAYPRVLDELDPGTSRRSEQYANDRIEGDHGQLKRRPRQMCGFLAGRAP